MSTEPVVLANIPAPSLAAWFKLKAELDTSNDAESFTTKAAPEAPVFSENMQPVTIPVEDPDRVIIPVSPVDEDVENELPLAIRVVLSNKRRPPLPAVAELLIAEVPDKATDEVPVAWIKLSSSAEILRALELVISNIDWSEIAPNPPNLLAVTSEIIEASIVIRASLTRLPMPPISALTLDMLDLEMEI
mmetsp:Transcript_17441/g.26155  ORF Transcript_17441/g.26155 Transcript_17441/m.26155 type:complete len:190 (+) Transcript_17441:3323-3892(+)